VSLHHAAVGEAAVVFIRIVAPWARAVGASASARLGELGCAIEIAEEQIHRAFQNLVGLLDNCSQDFSAVIFKSAAKVSLSPSI